MGLWLSQDIFSLGHKPYCLFRDRKPAEGPESDGDTNFCHCGLASCTKTANHHIHIQVLWKENSMKTREITFIFRDIT